jgi:hypothetical protein|tara:strand:+ start:190 stop:786 length:597 start_codon:yes stop_codon:yes gene_type:complete
MIFTKISLYFVSITKTLFKMLSSNNKLMFILLMFAGCKSINKPVDTSKSSVQYFNNCPENGDCSLEILDNQTAKIEYDKFNNSYITLEESKTTLLKFKYLRSEVPGTADSGYYEVIYLNIDKIDPNMVLKDKSLAEVDAIFGRMCFCTKESTGYFPIRKGVLKSKKNKNNQLEIDFYFTIKDVPHFVKSISETFDISN